MVPKSYDVKATVISVTGTCTAGHRVGEEFLIGEHTPAGICAFAYGALGPFITTLRYGGNFPWAEEPGVCRPGCPDHDNGVVFELRRITD